MRKISYIPTATVNHEHTLTKNNRYSACCRHELRKRVDFFFVVHPLAKSKHVFNLFPKDLKLGHHKETRHYVNTIATCKAKSGSLSDFRETDSGSLSDETSSEETVLFLQCPECFTIYDVLEASHEFVHRGRIVACRCCDHEWEATKDDLLTSVAAANEAAEMAVANASDVAASPIVPGPKQPYRLNKNQGSLIYVGNLSSEATGGDLTQIFSEHGKVLKCDMPVDEQGMNRGFAIVEMESSDESSIAVERLQGFKLYNQEVFLSVAKSNNIGN